MPKASNVSDTDVDQSVSNSIYFVRKSIINKQIWLSSPFSGPKRYDFLDQSWIYKHDGISLHKLLNKEFANIFKNDSIIDFEKCSYGRSRN